MKNWALFTVVVVVGEWPYVDCVDCVLRRAALSINLCLHLSQSLWLIWKVGAGAHRSLVCSLESFSTLFRISFPRDSTRVRSFFLFAFSHWMVCEFWSLFFLLLQLVVFVRFTFYCYCRAQRQSWFPGFSGKAIVESRRVLVFFPLVLCFSFSTTGNFEELERVAAIRYWVIE